jgi:hypothetical protein
MRKLLFSVLLVSACHREAPAPMKPALDPASAQLPLGARLQREAGSRPTGTPRAEEVLAAFTRQGLAIEGTMQVLASTVGAAYCASAGTPQGLAIAVCEYPAEAEARQGMEYSRRTFDRLIPGRRLLLNHKTLLTVTGVPDAEAKRAADIFARL